MEQIILEELVGRMEPEVQDAVRALAARDGVTHLVLFENHDFWSSQFGNKTALQVGPDCTYKTPEELVGRFLHDLPSQRQYATAFAEVGGE